MPKTVKGSSTSTQKKRSTIRRLRRNPPPIAYLGWGSELAIEFRNRARTASTKADREWLREQAKGFCGYIDALDDLQPIAVAAEWQLMNGEDSRATLARIVSGIHRLSMMRAFELNVKDPTWPTVEAYEDRSDTWQLDQKAQRGVHPSN